MSGALERAKAWNESAKSPEFKSSYKTRMQCEALKVKGFAERIAANEGIR